MCEFSGSLDHIVCLHLPWFFWSSFFIQLLTILPVDVQVSLHQNWPNFSKTVVFLFISYSTASSTNIIVCITFYLKVFYTNMLRDNLPLYMHFFFFFPGHWTAEEGTSKLGKEISMAKYPGCFWSVFFDLVQSLHYPTLANKNSLIYVCCLASPWGWLAIIIWKFERQ